MSDLVDMTPEARWRHLRENGKIPVDLVSGNSIDEKPTWFDETRWLRAKLSIEKYYVGVTFSSFTGLLLILQLPEGLEPLLATGNSKDVPSLHKRYLNTVLHVNSWYDDDIFNPETKGYKSIRQVRAMHKKVQSLMNEKFKTPGDDGKQRYWYNHYDVSMTQFAFIGLAMIYPEKSGLIAATDVEKEDINYYWRVLGYHMGVADEFNCCRFDKYEDIKKFQQLIFQHEFLDKFNTLPCEKGLEMTKSIVLALKYYVPLATFNSLSHWWKDKFHFNGYEPQPMTLKERALDILNKLSFGHLMKYETFLRLSTKIQRKRFAERLKNKDKVYQDLKEQYKDRTDLTYYSDRVDYFDKNTLTKAEEASASSAKPQDDPNNNSQADKKINEKRIPSGGCPFGFEAGIPSVDPQQQQQQQQQMIASA